MGERIGWLLILLAFLVEIVDPSTPFVRATVIEKSTVIHANMKAASQSCGGPCISDMATPFQCVEKIAVSHSCSQIYQFEWTPTLSESPSAAVEIFHLPDLPPLLIRRPPRRA